MSPRIRLIALWLCLTSSCFADESKKPGDPVEKLIDQLEYVSVQEVGYSGGNSGSTFLPLQRNDFSANGNTLNDPKGSSRALISLVKLGVKAVPSLLKHLDDDRKTKIVLKNRYGGMFAISQDAGEKADEEGMESHSPFRMPKQYTVRVGDLCYVALGQIVNRDYSMVRYIPTRISEFGARAMNR